MALACNIDRRGRRVRAVSGMILLLAGAGVTVLAWPLTWWQWILGPGLVVIGAFQMFEARAGWCVIRAFGWRTPI
jgi:hypothetical protein